MIALLGWIFGVPILIGLVVGPWIEARADRRALENPEPSL